MYNIQVAIFVNVLITVLSADIAWSPPCPTSCTCDFERGQKRAECEFESSSFRVNMTDVDSDVLLLDILPLSRGKFDAYGPSLPDLFGQFPKLLRLSVRNNGITNIPVSTAENLTRLHFLDLSGNNIRDLTDLHLEILDDIISLQLSGNLLDNIDENDLKPLRNLTTLGLSGNHISHIDVNAFDGLVYLSFLNLQDNNLEELAPKIFENIPRLNFLSLKHNEFREIPKGIQKLQLLDNVFLNENRITTVPVELVRIWNSTTTIEAIGLDGNPLQCDFSLAPFVQWAKRPSGFNVLCQAPKFTTANATENSTGCPVCASPDTLVKREVNTLTIRDLNSSQINATQAENSTLTPPAGTDFGYALLITLDFPRAPADFNPKRNATGPFALTSIQTDTMAKLVEFIPGAIVHCGTFKCYFFSVKGVREWRTAAFYCQTVGLDLVEIANATEQNEIYQFVRKTQAKVRKENDTAIARGGWIGIHYDKTAKFFVSASTGRPLAYTNWGADQPSNPDGEECVEMWDTGDWNDIRCVMPIPDNFVCQSSLAFGLELRDKHIENDRVHNSRILDRHVTFMDMTYRYFAYLSKTI